MDGTNVALPASPSRRDDGLVRIFAITVLALALAAAGASTAHADDGPGDDGDRFDVRVTGHCNGGASSACGWSGATAASRSASSCATRAAARSGRSS